MKKITAIILSISLCIILMPFSVVRAFTNIVEYSSGTFTNGAWITYYASNNNGYIVIDEFDIQNVNQFVQALVTKIDLNNNYDGVMEITLSGNISTNLWEFYIKGEGAYIISSDNNHVTVNLVHCQQFYLVACCANDNDLNFRPSSINSSSLILSSDSVYISPTYIQNFRFLINWDLPAGNVDRIEYVTDSLNGYSYFNSSLNNISVNRLDAQFDFEVLNGNYLVTSWYWRSSTNYTDPFPSPVVLIRDATNTNRHYESVSYFSQYISNSVSGYRVYEMTVYIPVYLISQSRSGRKYQISFQAGQNITNTSMVGFMFRGVVENLPSELLGNDVTNPSSRIDDVADQFTDITSQEHNITSGFESNLDTFNNSIDLQDYDFLSGISSATQYFKLQLENVFNVSSFVRAFWIIPVICVVLLRLLGG